jgi:hypothetical protein
MYFFVPFAGNPPAQGLFREELMLRQTALAAIFAGCALAWNHHDLNGSWQLIPERSEFHGEPAVETGRVTIDDREGNIYVSRSFNYDQAGRSTSSTFDTDARAKTSIKEPGIKSKTEWKGEVLQVTTTREGSTTVERYRLLDDGTMVLTVDRPGHAAETLFFRR